MIDMVVKRIAGRIALVVLVGGVAMLCLSSSMTSMFVGALTAVVVLVDMLVYAPRTAPSRPPSLDLTPRQITIDLDRRR